MPCLILCLTLVMQSSKPGTTIPINNVLISSTKSSHSSVFSLVKEKQEETPSDKGGVAARGKVKSYDYFAPGFGLVWPARSLHCGSPTLDSQKHNLGCF